LHVFHHKKKSVKDRLLILFFTYVAASAITVMMEEDVLFKNMPACADFDSLDVSSNGFDADFNIAGGGGFSFAGTSSNLSSVSAGMPECRQRTFLVFHGNRLPLYLLFHNFLFYDAA